MGPTDQMLITAPFGGDVSQEVVERGETHTRYIGPPIDEVREEFDYFTQYISLRMRSVKPLAKMG